MLLSEGYCGGFCLRFSWIKRCFDCVVACGALLLFAPLCVCISLGTLYFLGRPILFFQQRRGKGGKLFWMIKFRSMEAKPFGDVPSSQELSAYGRWLRKYSLDELPSLWNVIRGDLSLVGPRPLLPEFFCPLWRNAMQPGMTGLAQIRGRNAIGWRRKFRYDLWYLKRAYLGLDLYILIKTVPLLFAAHGTDLPSREDYFPDSSHDCLG